MEQKTEIKKIVLQLGKKDIELTVEECKKLKDLLSELFGRDVVKEVVKEIHHGYPYRWYWNYPQWNGDIVYCSGVSGDSAKLDFQNATLTCSVAK